MPTHSKLQNPERLFILWVLLALALLLPITLLLQGAFPIFTVVWLIVPLVAVLKTKDATRMGFRAVPWRQLAQATALNLGGYLLLTLLLEPWSHTYEQLLTLALSGSAPDTTFAWLLRFPRPQALTGMLFYSGLITLFAEELFFRGWLLQLLQKRWGVTWAIILQSLAFVIPNLLAALALPSPQGWLYALLYTGLGIGAIGGYAAARTGSIWPSLISATLSNLIFVILVG
ncbi:MAG: CAAX amino terminal protease self- immunity [Chloroflexi bacterium ADurb.Bin360]|nr:MAG: CAAX amino terminal protease self- immunity [Chloroflexi bacterium ADurb.Bin360]